MVICGVAGDQFATQPFPVTLTCCPAALSHIDPVQVSAIEHVQAHGFIMVELEAASGVYRD
jgi:hypothetical protein